MDESLQNDPLYPILLPSHLAAFDRRVGIILQTVRECLDSVKDYSAVFEDDGYWFRSLRVDRYRTVLALFFLETISNS